MRWQALWETYAPSFQGFLPVADEKVFAAYEKSVFGIMTGRTLLFIKAVTAKKAVRRSKFFWRRFGLRNRLWVNIRHRLE